MNHIQTPEEIDRGIALAVAKALAPQLDARFDAIAARLDAIHARLDERDSRAQRATQPQGTETSSGRQN